MIKHTGDRIDFNYQYRAVGHRVVVFTMSDYE